MTPQKLAAGIAAAGVLAGGGTVAVDRSIDPYTAVGAKLEIAAESTIPQAGTESFTADTTQPKITLSKFNGELNMGVTYDGMAPQTTGARPFLSKNVEWSDGQQTMQVVPLAASSTMEDGGYEINIVLNSEPASNVFNFSIDNADQLDFFYQPPLWQEAGLKAPTVDCTDTDCTMPEGLTHRPQDIVGSYAVYYKNHHDHIEGQTNYATGKAYNILRPKITDASGNTVWANLSYSNGILALTVPQSFLDNAAYPITVDPTFGYTTVGGTATARTSANAIRAFVSTSTRYLASSGDSVVQINTYGQCTVSGSGTWDVAVYSFASFIPVTRLATAQTVTINNTTAQWFNSVTFSGPLSAGSTYVVAIGNWAKGTCTALNFFTDAATTGDGSSGAAGTLPSTWSQTGVDNIKFSTYANYINGTPIDYYLESNADNVRTLGAGAALQADAQTFTGNGQAADHALWYLKKVLAPTGNAFAKIYATSGSCGTTGLVSGAALATSDAFDVSTLTTTSALVTFTFSGANKVTLTNGTCYALSVEFPGGDASNFIQVGADFSSPSHAGNEITFNGSWSAVSGADLPFYLYGTAAVVATPSSDDTYFELLGN